MEQEKPEKPQGDFVTNKVIVKATGTYSPPPQQGDKE